MGESGCIPNPCTIKSWEFIISTGLPNRQWLLACLQSCINASSDFVLGKLSLYLSSIPYDTLSPSSQSFMSTCCAKPPLTLSSSLDTDLVKHQSSAFKWKGASRFVAGYLTANLISTSNSSSQSISTLTCSIRNPYAIINNLLFAQSCFLVTYLSCT